MIEVNKLRKSPASKAGVLT